MFYGGALSDGGFAWVSGWADNGVIRYTLARFDRATGEGSESGELTSYFDSEPGNYVVAGVYADADGYLYAEGWGEGTHGIWLAEHE